MNNTSYLEISKSAYKQNLNFLQDVLGENCLFSSVIKGNAYGHGIETFSPMAEEFGVKHFSVFSAMEAYQVKSSLKGDCSIMIMGMIDDDDLEWVIENDIEFFVFNMKRANLALKLAKKLNKKAILHIELDTGMNRTGFDKKNLKDIADLLKNNADHLKFQGLCTHYAGAESIANYIRIQKQIKTFNSWNKYLVKQGLKAEQLHTACSAAAMAFSKTKMDMARIGIMQYGFWPSKEVLINYLTRHNTQTDPLKRVISWKSKVMSTQEVKTGEYIGYGNSFLAENDMKIATVPVGYGQGYSRSLSNQGRILINGNRVSVIGLVNMNMLIADISYTPETKEGDEVVLIGSQDDKEISVASFGELSAQLNYELLTRLPRDIPRKIIA